MPHQVGQEQEGPLQDSDQQQVLALVVARDVLGHRPDAVLEVVRLDEDLADLFAHGAAESRRHLSLTRARVCGPTRKRSPVATPGIHAISPADSTTGSRWRASRGILRSVNRSWSDLLPPSPSGRMRSPARQARTSSAGASASAARVPSAIGNAPRSDTSTPPANDTRPGIA